MVSTAESDVDRLNRLVSCRCSCYQMSGCLYRLKRSCSASGKWRSMPGLVCAVSNERVTERRTIRLRHLHGAACHALTKAHKDHSLEISCLEASAVARAISTALTANREQLTNEPMTMNRKAEERAEALAWSSIWRYARSRLE
jgi:hypothetical protein